MFSYLSYMDGKWAVLAGGIIFGVVLGISAFIILMNHFFRVTDTFDECNPAKPWTETLATCRNCGFNCLTSGKAYKEGTRFPDGRWYCYVCVINNLFK